jgi:hypothetical protein
MAREATIGTILTNLTMASVVAGAVLGAPIFGVSAASAQNDGARAHDPKACASDMGTPLNSPDTPTPKLPDATTGSGGNLSDKLARSDGVICPPDVDPDIKAPAPGGGKTPVIPPPGAPGGDPNVQPK